MKVKYIQLKNFKGFENINIVLNSKTNIIIGENNIGKSSLFEAILLWKKCFDNIIQSNKTSFYKIDKAGRYIPFNDLNFIRLINDTDLFYTSPNETRITLLIDFDNNEYNLTFEISKPKSIKDSYLRYRTINHREFERFAAALKTKRIKLTESIFVYQTKPVANILDKEPFMNKGQILKKISLGKSGEVLRNKIIMHDEGAIKKISKQVSDVLGTPVEFYFNNRENSSDDEYIDVKTFVGVKKLDLHLQGSGLLQVAEIFSTIEFMSEMSLNLLLIDEPDSHIHVKLQKKLLESIKKIENVQSFIISHNDNFVSEANNGELFYLNKKAKSDHLLTALEIKDFDIVKKELGGIITSLDKLNSAYSICFTEGEDDKNYIVKLKDKYIEITNKKVLSEPAFFHLRGKGDLIRKIEYYKRILPQIVKDKKYILVYDKDYCTIEKSEEYENILIKKLGTNSQVFRHNGYCIESVLFSQQDILINLLFKLSNIEIDKIKTFVVSYFRTLKNDLLSVVSDRYKNMYEKFKSQKTDERTELNGVDFGDFLNCTFSDDKNQYQYVFNKDIIKEFVDLFDLEFNTNILDVDDDNTKEYYSSKLYEKYIENITDISHFLNDSSKLLETLYKFEDEFEF